MILLLAALSLAFSAAPAAADTDSVCTTGNTVGGTCTVSTQAELTTAIEAVDAAAPSGAATTIEFGSDITLTDDLPILYGAATIDGEGYTLNGAGAFRGLLLYDPTPVSDTVAVTVRDLEFHDMAANGGNGNAGGGGGAGLGGAIFVASGVSLTASNLTFSDNEANGGNGGIWASNDGGTDGETVDWGGGGGGMGGAGGDGDAAGAWDSTGGCPGGSGTAGGGGGLGVDAVGASCGTLNPAGAGIAFGLGAGGYGVIFRPGNITYSDGGSTGGGGGAGGGSVYGAGGGGIGGYPGDDNSIAGDGGFGGGGGGGNSGIGTADGGFGGGGGSTCASYNGAPGGFGGGSVSTEGGDGQGVTVGGGGVGGFGGGGGAATGCAATSFSADGGGGGAGMGGAIFVQQGGSLTLGGTLAESGDSVAAGYGGANKGGGTGGAGSAYGSAIFLQGLGSTLTFDPASGQTQTLNGGIADQTGSGDSSSDASGWRLVMSGTGTLNLAGDNTYAGGTTVSSGTLEVSGTTSGDVTVSGGLLEIASGATLTGSVTVAAGASFCDFGTVTGTHPASSPDCFQPPIATISSPTSGITVQQGDSLTTSFSCEDGAGAPGLASCTDSNGAGGVSGSFSGRLDTSTPGTYTYTVTATSRDGLSTTTSITYTVQAPCTTNVTFQLTQVTTSGSACMYKQANGSYESTGPLKINGIPLPSLGSDSPYVITPPSAAHPGGMFGIQAGPSPTEITLDIGGTTGFDLNAGVISWNLPAVPDDGSNLATVAQLTVPAGQYLKGLQIGGSVAMEFGKTAGGDYYSTFDLTVDLPSVLKRGPSANAGGVTGTAGIRVDSAGAHFDGLSVQVYGAYIGSLQVKEACFSYLPSGASGAVSACPDPALPGSPLPSLQCQSGGGSSWAGSADIVLPTSGGPELSFYGDVTNSTLTGLSVAASHLKVPIAEDVFLTSVGVQLCLPNANEGLSIAGSVGVGALATGNNFGVTVTGAFAYQAAFQNNPWSLSLGGAVDVEGTQVGQGTLTFGGAPVISFDIQVGVSWSVVSVNGELQGFFETASPYQFSIDGSAAMCLSGIGCLTGQAAASSIGMSGCVGLGTFTYYTLEKDSDWSWKHPFRLHWQAHTDTLEAGFGYYWHGSVSLWAASCDIGNYELAGPSAADQFVVPSGSQAMAVRIAGHGGAPQVKLVGPHGVVVETPAHGTGRRIAGVALLERDASQDATSVLLLHPAAGRWRVVTLPHSVALAGVRTAGVLTPPVVVGGVRRERSGRVGVNVAYSLAAGEKLTLYATGPHKQQQMIGRANGRRCILSTQANGRPSRSYCAQRSFAPTYGLSGRRTVYALVTRAGLVVERVKLGAVRLSFSTPKASKPVIVRTTDGVQIWWGRVAHVAHYAVGVVTNDGRKLSFTTGGLMVKVADISSATTVSATVWPVMTDGVVGRSASGKLAAGQSSSAPTHKAKPKKHKPKPKKHKPKPKKHKPKPTPTPKSQTVRITIGSVPSSHGPYTVHAGSLYDLVVTSKAQPYYVDAAAVPAKPRGAATPFFRIGRAAHGDSRWRIYFSFASSRVRAWNVGVRVGGHLYVVRVDLR